MVGFADGFITAEEIAERRNMPLAEAKERIARMVSAGLIEQQGEQYKITPRGQQTLAQHDGKQSED